MLTEIYLVRHAQSDYSSGSEETRTLSARGHVDALAVTELLLNERVQVVCSSPYVRAIQTVEGTANFLGVPIELDERFRERNFAERNVVVDPMEAMERGFIESDFIFPGGESNRDVELRGINALTRVLRKYAGKRVAIGIHGGIMTIIMGHYDDRCFGMEFLRNLPKPAIYKLTFINEEYIGAEAIGTFGA